MLLLLLNTPRPFTPVVPTRCYAQSKPVCRALTAASVGGCRSWLFHEWQLKILPYLLAVYSWSKGKSKAQYELQINLTDSLRSSFGLKSAYACTHTESHINKARKGQNNHLFWPSINFSEKIAKQFQFTQKAKFSKKQSTRKTGRSFNISIKGLPTNNCHFLTLPYCSQTWITLISLGSGCDTLATKSVTWVVWWNWSSACQPSSHLQANKGRIKPNSLVTKINKYIYIYIYKQN